MMRGGINIPRGERGMTGLLMTLGIKFGQFAFLG